MSSPTTTPKRTPKRTTPKRGPLSERSPSQKNEAAGRLRRESKPDLTDVDIFTTTPFPTKPQHVLLPSTIRKQRSRQNVENELPNLFLNWSQPEISSSATRAQNRQDERRVRRAPKIQLKQSVTALRDMYEAQAESSRPSTAIHSRPSTAVTSPAVRPTSSRLRSVSSSEALSGRSAWDMFGLPKVSVDDLAMLPTLSEDVQPLDSEQSFASRVRNQGASSSPNFRTFGTSSPGLPTFHDVATSSDPVEESSSSALEVAGESSPNFVQLHHSSSMISTDPTPPSLGADEPETSPNIVKLGTSSPKRSSSPTPSEVSTISRKRKRSNREGSANAGRTPLFFAGRNRTHSSPPLRNVPASSDASLRSDSRVLPSSPPEAESANSQSQPTSSPVFRMPVAAFSADRSSIASAHTNLQSILSSSPGPPIQRPIVRAPNVNQFERLSLQKRNTSGPAKLETDTVQRPSPVQSVANIEVQQLSSTNLDQFHHSNRRASRVSAFSEDLDDPLDSESIAPAQAYMIEHDLNSSQINMISDADHHEATDELGALPREHSSFAAALSQARNAGYLSSSSSSNSLSRFDSLRTSLDGRLQSMRSCTYSREDSIYRPGSSASYMSQNVVPTWARRYYSGFYQDSFQYLYQSSKNLGYPVIEVRPSSRRASVPASIPASSSYETISTTSNLRQSLSRSVRSSIKSFRLSIPLPTSRPRLNARQSHTTAGVGPLVSNPVRPQSELMSPPPSAYRNRHTIRRVSAPISAVDPRFHWNGIIEEPETPEEAEKLEDSEYANSLQHAESMSVRQPWRPSRNSFGPPARFIRLPTPHLHQDRRLHTGSSASHGFGAPYNARPRWQPSDGYTDKVRQPSWFKIDLKDTQVICFMAGFVFPLMWFIAALTPLPTRPTSYHDLEKMEVGLHNSYGARSNLVDDWTQTDIVARLRLEKHIRGLEEVKWQNARWWRRMNRWMCCVGVVVLIIVIVLAVIGTKGHWA